MGLRNLGWIVWRWRWARISIGRQAIFIKLFNIVINRNRPPPQRDVIFCVRARALAQNYSIYGDGDGDGGDNGHDDTNTRLRWLLCLGNRYFPQ